VVNLSPAVAQDLGVDPFAGRGVLVTKIGPGFALNAGLRPGDFIREVNGKRDQGSHRRRPGGLRRRRRRQRPAWVVTIERNGQRGQRARPLRRRRRPGGHGPSRC
jgi:C-terminal processing protease CtpA/Prc